MLRLGNRVEVLTKPRDFWSEGQCFFMFMFCVICFWITEKSQVKRRGWT
jgi:hypothetical protein